VNKPPNNQDTPHSRGKDIIVIFILIIVFSLILEQTIRFYLFGNDSFSYYKMKSVGSMGYTGYLKKSDMPEVVYEFKPGLDSYFKLAGFKTNSQGLRDKEYSLETPPTRLELPSSGVHLQYRPELKSTRLFTVFWKIGSTMNTRI